MDRSGHSRRGDTPQCTGGAADVLDVALWVRSGQRRGRTWAVPGWYPKIAGECIFFPPKCSNDRFPKSSTLKFPKSWGYLVLKAMVTWGSFILVKPHRDVDFFRFDGKKPLEKKSSINGTSRLSMAISWLYDQPYGDLCNGHMTQQ